MRRSHSRAEQKHFSLTKHYSSVSKFSLSPSTMVSVTTAISKEANFDTSFNPHMEELTECEAVSRVQPVGSQSCRAQLWCPAKAKLTTLMLSPPNQAAVPSHPEETTQLMSHRPLSLSSWLLKATWQHGIPPLPIPTAQALLFLTGPQKTAQRQKTLVLLLKTCLNRHCSLCFKIGPICTKLNSAGENTSFHFAKFEILEEKKHLNKNLYVPFLWLIKEIFCTYLGQQTHIKLTVQTLPN